MKQLLRLLLGIKSPSRLFDEQPSRTMHGWLCNGDRVSYSAAYNPNLRGFRFLLTENGARDPDHYLDINLYVGFFHVGFGLHRLGWLSKLIGWLPDNGGRGYHIGRQRRHE